MLMTFLGKVCKSMAKLLQGLWFFGKGKGKNSKGMAKLMQVLLG